MSSYIHFTEEQKEQARQTDLCDLLQRQGEKLKRSGREYEWRDGSQKVTIRGNLWFHQYERVGGDAIDFVRKYFEEQGIDTDKLNMEMIVTFPGMAAQQESVNISGNMRWSYQKRMQSGEFNCTCPAYGFDLVNGQMVINETEAIVIRRIFSLYLQGFGMQAIANMLNEDGIPRRYGHTHW